MFSFQVGYDLPYFWYFSYPKRRFFVRRVNTLGWGKSPRTTRDENCLLNRPRGPRGHDFANIVNRISGISIYDAHKNRELWISSASAWRGSLRFRFQSGHKPGDIERRVVLMTTRSSMSPGLCSDRNREMKISLCSRHSYHEFQCHLLL